MASMVHRRRQGPTVESVNGSSGLTAGNTQVKQTATTTSASTRHCTAFTQRGPGRWRQRAAYTGQPPVGGVSQRDGTHCARGIDSTRRPCTTNRWVALYFGGTRSG